MKVFPQVLLFLCLIFGILTIFYFLKGQNPKITQNKTSSMLPTAPGKKAVMIIAFRNFRDQEYFIPKQILEEAGVKVQTASNKVGMAVGADGGEAKVDFLVSEIVVSDFDAIIFVGGPGCLDALDNEESYRVVTEAISQNKVLASICISPVILAKAGALNGKRATVWSSPFDKGPINILKSHGAIYEDLPVVVDDKIITANGPEAAEDFAKAILEALR